MVKLCFARPRRAGARARGDIEQIGRRRERGDFLRIKQGAKARSCVRAQRCAAADFIHPVAGERFERRIDRGQLRPHAGQPEG